MYIVIGKLSLLLSTFHPSASPVWPPTGFALAALLLLGMRYWPAVFIGAFVVNATTEGSILTSLLIAAGNTLEAIAGTALTVRFANGTKAFERLDTAVFFTVIAVFSSALISSVIGVGTLMFAGLVSQQNMAAVWLTWWIGNTVGALTVAPLIIVWCAKEYRRWEMNEAIEAICLYALLIAVSELVFNTSLFPHTYIALFPILIIVIRLKPQMVITGVAMMAVIAVHGTLQREGPFWNYSPAVSLLYLQAYMILVSVGAITFAASQNERRQMEESLEYKVKERTAELAISLERERTKLQQLRNVVSRFEVATIAADEHMNILHANKEFHTLFPNTHDDSDPRTLLRIFSDVCKGFNDPEKTLDDLRQLLGERRRIDSRVFVLKDGKEIFCDYHPVMDDGSHRGHLLMFRTQDTI